MKKNMIDKVLQLFMKYTNQLISENVFVDYNMLQKTWNHDILQYSCKYLPDEKQFERIISLGTFTGAMEMALSSFGNWVHAIDLSCYLPEWAPKNIVFQSADFDSCTWEFPEEQYDMCFMVEVLEHMRWSPLPLLKWIQKHCNFLVITTPDDNEWPSMPVKPWNVYQNFSNIPVPVIGGSGNPSPMSHIKQYTQEEFIEMLTYTGFRLLEFQRIGDGKHQMLAICNSR